MRERCNACACTFGAYRHHDCHVPIWSQTHRDCEVFVVLEFLSVRNFVSDDPPRLVIVIVLVCVCDVCVMRANDIVCVMCV